MSKPTVSVYTKMSLRSQSMCPQVIAVSSVKAEVFAHM